MKQPETSCDLTAQFNPTPDGHDGSLNRPRIIISHEQKMELSRIGLNCTRGKSDLLKEPFGYEPHEHPNRTPGLILNQA
jgi:hypothetical protein